MHLALEIRKHYALTLKLIDVTDESPFFIRPFHANEEDKVIFGQRNEMTVLFRHTKGRFLSLLQSSDANK